jgi:hypothetical protein
VIEILLVIIIVLLLMILNKKTDQQRNERLASYEYSPRDVSQFDLERERNRVELEAKKAQRIFEPTTKGEMIRNVLWVLVALLVIIFIFSAL